jgi:hypothetical protein
MPLGRSFYLSDPYALQIMGQWDGEEARWRRGSLNLVREGRVAEAMAAARTRVPRRPFYVVLTESQARSMPEVRETLVRGGASVVASNPICAIYSLPEP